MIDPKMFPIHRNGIYSGLLPNTLMDALFAFRCHFLDGSVEKKGNFVRFVT